MKDASTNIETQADPFGPGIHFQAEPLLSVLSNKEEHLKSCGDRNLVIVVAGWPHKPDFVESQYNRFTEFVQQCFDPEDLETVPNNLPSVYIYPAEALHVTVATLFPHTPSATASDQRRLQNLWKSILDEASNKPTWPKAPLKLQIASSQIGIKAGILQWEETTGGIIAMRKTIRQVIQANQSFCPGDKEIIQKLHTPNIVHTTFLRFAKVPKTPGEVVQDRFQRLVQPFLKECFSKEIPLTSAAMVRERIPYMHIPKDDHHILKIYELGHLVTRH